MDFNHNRIRQLFDRKKENILNIYFTAGHPTLDSTGTIIRELSQAGVDLIEVPIDRHENLAQHRRVTAAIAEALR